MSNVFFRVVNVQNPKMISGVFGAEWVTEANALAAARAKLAELRRRARRNNLPAQYKIVRG